MAVFNHKFLDRLHDSVAGAFERDLARLTAETDRCLAKRSS